MRRPQATTVSAASIRAGSPCHLSAAARAFASARRSAWTRGTSPLRTVSSKCVGRTASGTIPACTSNALRRGLSLASTSASGGLFEAIGDAPFGKVIGRHFHENLVACEDADAVLAHLAGGMGDDLVSIFKFHAKGGIGQQFADRAGKFKKLFFGHPTSFCAKIAAEIALKRWKSKFLTGLQPLRCNTQISVKSLRAVSWSSSILSLSRSISSAEPSS